LTDIANAFNDYYINIGPSLANNISTDHIQIPNTMPELNLRNCLFLTPATELEISAIINKLKSKTSTGIDKISCKVIKQSDQVIIPPLTYIINISMETGTVPNHMKMAKVIPVYKNKEINELKNYRPISLLPAFSKILEKVVYKRLYQYFNNNGLFFNSQYGFRPSHSTELAINEFQDIIIKNIKNKLCSLGIFLDLSKAFDTLQHEILINKLQHYGVRGIALQWFQNYLTNRFQTVNIDNIFYDKRKIVCGVPQGSVLGPLLFLVYINDLPNVSKIARFIVFADDTNIIYSNKDIRNLETTSNNDLQNISDWFRLNKLSLNISKTKFIIFDTKNKLQKHSSINFEIKLNSINITRVTETKFLGVTLKDNLTWISHINEKCKKISQTLALLKRLKHEVPLRTLKTIYSSLIEPHMIYAITAWGSLSSSYKRLILLQKRALRIINKAKYSSHTEPLFKSSEILKINDH
jgi:hypothetical protein